MEYIPYLEGIADYDGKYKRGYTDYEYLCFPVSFVFDRKYFNIFPQDSDWNEIMTK